MEHGGSNVKLNSAFLCSSLFISAHLLGIETGSRDRRLLLRLRLLRCVMLLLTYSIRLPVLPPAQWDCPAGCVEVLGCVDGWNGGRRSAGMGMRSGPRQSVPDAPAGS
eukprot:1109162-Rhodomonas_salina.1